jgi:Bacterial archaeo-eukaryotic release factor family 7
MDTICIDDLKHLAGLREATAISLYLPTHLAPGARQDAIRLKNLLERAEDELEAHGLRRGEAQELLSAAGKLPADADFWKGLSQGLAIFVTPKLFRAYRLPLAFDESLTIHSRLNIKPLLPAIDRGERFLLLALSQNHVRLLDATRSSIKEVAVKGLPQNKRQALNYDGADRGEQVHEGMRGNLGKQASIFHGQGGEKDTAKGDLVQFFQIISRALEPVLRNETAPLLLAGVDYLLPLFRHTCSYSHLFERHLAGNCDQLTNRQLHERSLEIIGPYFDRPRRDALEKLCALLGTGKASVDVAEVAEAATTGKIDVLFADVRQEQRGKFDPSPGKALVCDGACDGSEDLVNLAVAETLLHGGAVYAAERRQLPAEAVIAASYRY